jgi:hypothetical protein
MKKLIIAAVTVLYASVGMASAPIEVNEKVLESFKQTFKDPKKTSWFESKEGYVVYFVCDEIDSRVCYDKKGNILKTCRYYNEFKLPPLLLNKLKKNYSDKTVFVVTEIADETGIAYYIKLQDAKNWVTVKADQRGNMEIVEKFKKA